MTRRANRKDANRMEQQTFVETLDPEAILRAAVATYEPRIVVAAVSGGRDSIAAAHVASQHPRFAGVLHLNTGIGIEETRQFVRDVCQDRGWRLWEYRAVDNCRADGTPDPMVYERLCIEHGFPGPDQHRKMYSKLKQRPLAMFLRHMKKRRGDRIMIVDGIRSQESVRRMGTAALHRRDVKTGCYWSSPLYYFDKDQRDDYTAAYDLPVNPVSERLCMSGECKCGAYATIGERDLDRFFYPDFAADLDRIEEAVQAARNDYNVWGWAATPDHARRWTRQRVPEGQSNFLPLCVGCDNRMAMQAEIIGEQDDTKG
jgi:3'-phosphoadenosine 5'-phosphosulfate sulfotransferase (PAPS reductase)/FAD synthetase